MCLPLDHICVPLQVLGTRGATLGANPQGGWAAAAGSLSNLADVISKLVGHVVGPLELAQSERERHQQV